jgi:lipoprotein-releasing system permease protein
MYILTVALRHLRTRPMSWVTAAIIVIIVILYLLIISVLEGFKTHYMDKLQSIQAHFTVRVGNIPWGVVAPEKWAGELEGIPGVRGATIGLEIPVLAQFDTGRTVGSLRGVDLDRELRHGRLKEILKPADLTEFGVHPDARDRSYPGCIVGGYWRRTFNLEPGKHATFLFTDQDENPRAMAFRIVGFFEGHSDYLENAAYVDRKLLAREMKMEGCAKTLSLWVEGDPDRADLDRIRAEVRARVDQALRRDAAGYPDFPSLLIVESWREKDSNFYHALTRENAIMRFIMGLFLAFVVIIILLILGRLVAEKARDIGALRAMGATPRGVCACFLAQGLALAVIGLALGLPLAAVLIGHINEVEAFVRRGLEVLFGVRNFRVFPASDFLVDKIPTRLLTGDMVLISLLTLCSGLLGALLPALRAARQNVVECLRHE